MERAILLSVCFTAGNNFREIVLRLTGICLIILSAGCSEPPPPPPPAPPPPSTPVAMPADRDVALKVVEPYFFLVFDWGFSTSDSVVETRDGYLDFRRFWKLESEDLSVEDFYNESLLLYVASGNPMYLRNYWDTLDALRVPEGRIPLSDRIKRVLQTVPSLKSLLSTYFEPDTAASNYSFYFPVVAFRRVPPTVPGYPSIPPYLLPSAARKAVLAMYAKQALKDASDGNWHRAHVLLTDVQRMLNLENQLFEASGQGLGTLFEEVVDNVTIDRFTATLSGYTESQANSLVVSGEDAAILRKAGLEESSEFVRAAILAKFELLVVPLIEEARKQATNAGFRTPDSLTNFQSAIRRHIDVLKGDGKVIEKTEYLKDALGPDNPKAVKLLAMLKTGSDKSFDKILSELRGGGHRSIATWYGEKALLAGQHPLRLINPDISSERLSIAMPLASESSEEFTRADSIQEFVRNHPSLGPAVAEWCAGKELPESCDDGSGHFLIGWYWLELKRPSLARQAWIAGARHCLESIADGERVGKRSLASFAREMNAYRFLVAASFIREAPPGVVIDRTSSYEAEIRALSVKWQAAWVQAGHPNAAADRIIADLFRLGTGPERLGSATSVSERYPFFEYRFQGGSAPDVVVDEAVAAQVFDMEGGLMPPTEPGDYVYKRLVDFVSSFHLPTDFSKNARNAFAN